MASCAACWGAARKRCSVCKCVAYCGRECQVRHWPVHMKYCALLTTRPAELAASRVDTHFRIGRTSHCLSLSPLMPGEVLLDAVSEALRQPADRMKIVHRGRIVTLDAFQALICPGAAFMVIASQDPAAQATQRLNEAQAAAVLMSELHLEPDAARLASALAGKLQEYSYLD